MNANAVYLALGSLACFAFFAMNFLFNDANPIIPGWALMGVILGVAAALVFVFTDDGEPEFDSTEA